MYVTKVLTDLTQDGVRKSTSTSTSICSVGSHAKNAIDLECEERSLKNEEPSVLPNSRNGENVLSLDNKMTMKRGREKTVEIDNDIVVRREGKEKENANKNEIEKDLNKESEKKKKTERDKENEIRIKTESKSGSKNGNDNDTEKRRVELRNKESQELTAAVRLSLGLSHTIQPVCNVCVFVRVCVCLCVHV